MRHIFSGFWTQLRALYGLAQTRLTSERAIVVNMADGDLLVTISGAALSLLFYENVRSVGEQVKRIAYRFVNKFLRLPVVARKSRLWKAENSFPLSYNLCATLANGDKWRFVILADGLPPRGGARIHRQDLYRLRQSSGDCQDSH